MSCAKSSTLLSHPGLRGPWSRAWLLQSRQGFACLGFFPLVAYFTLPRHLQGFFFQRNLTSDLLSKAHAWALRGKDGSLEVGVVLPRSPCWDATEATELNDNILSEKPHKLGYSLSTFLSMLWGKIKSRLSKGLESPQHYWMPLLVVGGKGGRNNINNNNNWQPPYLFQVYALFLPCQRNRADGIQTISLMGCRLGYMPQPLWWTEESSTFRW